MGGKGETRWGFVLGADKPGTEMMKEAWLGGTDEGTDLGRVGFEAHVGGSRV